MAQLLPSYPVDGDERVENTWQYSVRVDSAGIYGLTAVTPFLFSNGTPQFTFYNGATVTVDWGDGTTAVLDANSTEDDHKHTYDVSETTEFTITLTSDRWSSIATSFQYYGESSGGFPSNLYKLLTPIPKLHSSTSFQNMCNCAWGLTYVADGLFKNNTYAQTFERAFYDTTELTEIPADMFAGCVNAKSFATCFESSGITSIPNGLFDDCVSAESFLRCFNQSNVANIPAGLFDNCPKAQTFYHCFQGTDITEVPEGLFDNCPDVLNFCGLFAGCISLAKVPSKLFVNNTKVTDFSMLLPNAPIVANTECPDGTPYFSLDITSEDVTAFYNSGSYRYFWIPSRAEVDAVYINVPEGSTTETTALAYNESYPSYAMTLNTTPCIETWEFDTIADCTYAGVPISTLEVTAGMTIDWGDGSVTTVTSDMTLAEAYTHTYAEAGQYHIVVSYNDWKNVNIACSDQEGMYQNVTALNAARESIAKIYVIPKVADASFTNEQWPSLFSIYSNLTEIEAGLFDNNPQIEYLSFVFGDCYSLVNIPEDLFVNLTSLTNLASALSGCPNRTNQTIYIGSEIVTNANHFMNNNGSGNTVYVPEGSTTETTFNSASNVGATVATYTP